MRQLIAPYRHRHSRRLLAAWALSALGNGAGHVALMLVAYKQLGTPWAVSAVLLAEFLPAMALGPQLGALADRHPRRLCAAGGLALGALAFTGMAFVASLPLFALLSLLAGLGNAIAQPAVLAGLPALVGEEDLPATTSAFSSLEEAGFVLGPVLAAVLFAAAGTDGALLLNAVTFVVAAAVATTLPLGHARTGDAAAAAEDALAVRAALRAIRKVPVARAIVLATGPIAACFGLFTAAEVVFATDELHLSASGFSLLAAVLSIGMTAGALVSPHGRHARVLYAGGVALAGAGLVVTASLGSLLPVAIVYVLVGLGNGAAAVQERLLMQQEVPSGLLGCAFGARGAASSWGMAIAYVAGGGLMAAAGTRPLLLAAGLGLLVVAAWLTKALLPATHPAHQAAPQLA